MPDSVPQSPFARSNLPMSDVGGFNGPTQLTDKTYEHSDSADLENSSHITYTLLVGGYAGLISVIQFDERTRKLSNVSSLSNEIVGESPSWITPTRDGKYFYSSNEVSTKDGRNATGSIVSYKLAGHNTSHSTKTFGSVGIVINPITQAYTSPDPVFIDLSPDQYNLLVASYTDGTASRYELNDDHSFKSLDTPSQLFSYNATGPNKSRQSHSYIHQVRYDPTGRIAAFVDLGGDRVYVHSVNSQTGKLSPMHTIELQPGTGPRHLSFVVVDRVRTDIYLICELSNEMVYIELTYLTDHSIHTEIRQTLSTLPIGISTNNTYGAGEVIVSTDGRYVYGTNRQTDMSQPATDNSVVIFTRDPTKGQLTPQPRFVPLVVTGATPRHICLSPDTEERWMVVVGQQANKLAVYERESGGGGLELVDSIDIALPAVARFLPLSHHGHHHDYRRS